MGRQLRRVPLDFEWPLDKPWDGFINEYYSKSRKCSCCKGAGYSPVAQKMADQWYGMEPFSPRENGSFPYRPNDCAVRDAAERNVTRSPEFYGSGEFAIFKIGINDCIGLWQFSTG